MALQCHAYTDGAASRALAPGYYDSRERGKGERKDKALQKLCDVKMPMRRADAGRAGAARLRLACKSVRKVS